MTATIIEKYDAVAGQTRVSGWLNGAVVFSAVAGHAHRSQHGDYLMKTIAATVINEVVTPIEPMPSDASLIVFNGTEYVIYEDGDELPVIEQLLNR